MATNNEAQKQVKIIRSPKTERSYERVADAYDLCRVLAKHGDRIAFSYYDKQKNLCDLSYERFYNRIVRTAAGLTKKGLKRGEWRYLSEGETNLLRMGAYL